MRRSLDEDRVKVTGNQDPVYKLHTGDDAEHAEHPDKVIFGVDPIKQRTPITFPRIPGAPRCRGRQLKTGER
jgi:hypothetical protein